jgi:hypothetical protein
VAVVTRWTGAKSRNDPAGAGMSTYSGVIVGRIECHLEAALFALDGCGEAEVASEPRRQGARRHGIVQGDGRPIGEHHTVMLRPGEQQVLDALGAEDPARSSIEKRVSTVTLDTAGNDRQGIEALALHGLHPIAPALVQTTIHPPHRRARGQRANHFAQRLGQTPPRLTAGRVRFGPLHQMQRGRRVDLRGKRCDVTV